VVIARGTVLLASVLLLGACSDSGADETKDAGTGLPSQETALESLTPDRLCELLPNDAVEQALDVKVNETSSRETGRPPFLSMTCTYDLEFELMEVEILPPSVRIDVGQIRDKGVDELLDDAFTDLIDDSRPVGDYERVDGLGEGAGYGADPTHGGALDQSQLVVIFKVGDEVLRSVVAVSPQTPLDQMKPLATDLLKALESELA
jgi:hypothetical protein